ncbi:exported hypothetical protein [Candidatus Terasakiella magnetica]|uniref:Bacterial EndoU nuclease domain-containing protein n=1 Tax=Candidatus Terasakiella magnetica TaxID=1867952 RepID=A0A1C3RLH6_9PROT|nr:EndoU domain-containing protein [Candidatus Terasakiella magnetica]SCA58170.1 exported hypothetical protein [Candidatus Terasakiella magnetica]
MRTPFNIIFFDKKTIRAVVFSLQVAFVLSCWSFGVFAAEWSETTPPINLTHIFKGEINKQSRAVGFHARPFGKDPEGAELSEIRSGPNQYGVYTGSAEIFDPEGEEWKPKNFSSFFPDLMTQNKVVEAILAAYKKAKVNKRGKWRGRSSYGFSIEGWLCPKGGTSTCPDGAINTAYPIYKKDK